MLHCLKLFWLNWGFPLKVVGVYLIGWFWLCSEIHNEDEFEFTGNTLLALLITDVIMSIVFFMNQGLEGFIFLGIMILKTGVLSFICSLIPEKVQVIYQLLIIVGLLLTTRYVYIQYLPGMYERWLEITQRCNMHCVHCYEGESHSTASEKSLTLEEWKKVIHEVVDLKPKRIVVIGGEPCLHKDIISILKYIRELDDRISITLFTNGYFLKGELINIIVENRIEVKLSMYGHCAEIHDRITGIGGSFDRLVGAIDTLQKHDVPVNIAVTLMKENECYYEEIKDFVLGLKVRGYKFDVIREVIDGTQNDHKPILKSIIEKAYRTTPNFYVQKLEFDSNYYFNSCWKGKIVITETGDVLPCVFGRNHICGNIREQSIKSIITQKGNNSLRKLWEKSLRTIEIWTFVDANYNKKCLRSADLYLPIEF